MVIRKKSVATIVNREGIGALMRVHAHDESLVAGRVVLTTKAVEHLTGLTGPKGQSAFRKIIILVWSDPRFVNQGNKSDCGLTAEALRSAMSHEIGQKVVTVLEIKHGDLFCSVLNRGCGELLRSGMDWSLVVSPEAVNYLTQETFDAVVKAAAKGAHVVGVAIHELFESILERGRIANTLALWHTMSLIEQGGFDALAASRPDDRTTSFLRGLESGGSQVFYRLTGVEEVIPAARLVDTFGPCIAVVAPRGEGVAPYTLPQDPENLVRHIAKMATKEGRQDAHLARAGFHSSILENGVMFRDIAG